MKKIISHIYHNKSQDISSQSETKNGDKDIHKTEDFKEESGVRCGTSCPESNETGREVNNIVKCLHFEDTEEHTVASNPRHKTENTDRYKDKGE